VNSLVVHKFGHRSGGHHGEGVKDDIIRGGWILSGTV